MEPQHQGIEPLLRTAQSGSDSGLLALVMGCFIVNALLFPILMRLWRSFFRQLLRQRSDALPGERTSSERFVLAISLVQTLVFEGLALYCLTSPGASRPLASMLGLTTLALLLLGVQTAGYLAVGYAFATPAETRTWLRAFFTSQSLAGYLLIIPSMGALFYPQYSHAFLIGAAAAYALCRILFYIKGFTFFYTSPASLFYFFLYLCTLEMVPLAIVASLTSIFSALFC